MRRLWLYIAPMALVTSIGLLAAFEPMCSGSPEGELTGAIVFVLLVGIALAGGATWAAELRRARKYRAFAHPRGSFLPEHALPPALTSRIAEAAILAAAGTVVLVMTATNRSTGGLLLTLDQVIPAVAKAHLTVFVCAAVGALAAAVLALLRETAAGVLLMAAVLCLYGWFLNGSDSPLDQFVSLEQVEPVTQYVITLEHEIAGAELWVNDVYLGKTPIEMTKDAFYARVPPWPTPPKGYRDRSDAVHLTRHWRSREITSYRQRWMRFIPPSRRGRKGRLLDRRTGHSKFYARVKLDGEWGGGRGARGGSGAGRYSGIGQTELKVCFPMRLGRIETLLDWTRLRDYAVTPKWARAMDTYGEQGWLILCEAGQKEPALNRVLDAWAAWHYGLDGVSDSASAWFAFRRICDEVNERRQYSTASMAGRAVEQLVPKLDPKQLVTEALRAIRQYRSWPNPTTFERKYGREQFSVLAGRERTAERAPADVGVLAHAVWVMDGLLNASPGSEPNLIERHIPPALIGRRPFTNACRAACILGGRDVEQFLFRSDWRTDPAHSGKRSLNAGLSISPWRRPVNHWLYLIANLPTQAGRDFRLKRKHALLQLAERLLGGFRDHRPLDLYGFLFLDLDRGSESLAAQFWPRYRAFAAQYGDRTLTIQWRYLTRMEPVSTVEMYVDAWRTFGHGYPYADDALDELDVLPPEKRQAVLDGLVHEIRETEAVPKDWRGSLASWQDRMVHDLMHHASDDYVAEEVLAKLHTEPSGKHRRRIALWLEHTRPDHPLVAMLTEDADPELRLLVMGALRSHPPPANRELMRQLLADPDPKVKAAAEEVEAALRSLAATDPSELAAGGLVSKPSQASEKEESE